MCWPCLTFCMRMLGIWALLPRVEQPPTLQGWSVPREVTDAHERTQAATLLWSHRGSLYRPVLGWPGSHTRFPPRRLTHLQPSRVAPGDWCPSALGTCDRVTIFSVVSPPDLPASLHQSNRSFLSVATSGPPLAFSPVSKGPQGLLWVLPPQPPIIFSSPALVRTLCRGSNQGVVSGDVR